MSEKFTSNKVQEIMDTIMSNARTGSIGDGKILVNPVAEVMRSRSSESGDAAV